MFSFDLFYFFRRENNLSRRESFNQYREIDYLKQGKQERKGDNCHFDSAT